MIKPKLTKSRIIVAFAVAVIADLLEFPITAAEATVIGAPAGELGAVVVDIGAFGIMTWLLGFHWMFLPSFAIEVVPGIDMLPTWVGCVGYVVWQRKKADQPRPAARVVQAIEVEDTPPKLIHARQPPLPPSQKEI
jgi:hypothetical protein